MLVFEHNVSEKNIHIPILQHEDIDEKRDELFGVTIFDA